MGGGADGRRGSYLESPAAPLPRGPAESEIRMARIDVIMPQMGESIAEGTLSRWMKKVGESVQRDEPIFEISTDKVDAEIPAPNAGVLAEILVQEGQTVSVQTVVARIETDATAGAAAKPPPPARPRPHPPPPREPAPRGTPAERPGAVKARHSLRSSSRSSCAC